MPTSAGARRVVVLTADAYQRLAQPRDEPPAAPPALPPSPPPPPPPSPETPPPPPPTPPPILDPWLARIPTRFQKEAARVKTLLDRIPQLDQSREVLHLNGQSVGLTLAELLRALCVPLVRTKLPAQLRHLLTENRIKSRNHLALSTEYQDPRPAWRTYFRV